MANTPIRLTNGALGGVQGAGSDALLYTVPASTTVLIRNIHIVNRNISSALKCRLSIGADGAASRILPADYLIPANGVFDFGDDTFVVLNAGETLHWTGETSDLIIYISGVSINPIITPVMFRWGPTQGAGIGTTSGSWTGLTGTVLRNIIAVNNDTVDRSFRMYFQEPATGAPGLDFLPATTSPYVTIKPNGFYIWSGYYVWAGTFNFRAEAQISVMMNGIKPS